MLGPTGVDRRWVERVMHAPTSVMDGSGADPENPARGRLSSSLPSSPLARTRLGFVGRSAPTGASVTSDGHPRAVVKRSIERGNLLGAELAIREMGVVSLREALELTALVA